MIPKIIHYCWFGRNPLPKLAVMCIASWRKYLPDYEIKEWNEDNFDVNIIPYTRDAYKEKKYAFVSDYARFWIIYKYGGVYFDTDVEVIKPFDDILLRGAFMGCERDNKFIDFSETTDRSKMMTVAAGLGIAANKGHQVYLDVLELYTNLSFYNKDGTINLKTVVYNLGDVLYKNGFENKEAIQNILDIWIYPKEYFCPKDFKTGKLTITDNTYSIHHYDASWVSNTLKLKIKLKRIIRKFFFINNKIN